MSLDILNLLSEPLDCQLHVDNVRPRLDVPGLGTERVHLSKQLLAEEVKLLAYRLRASESFSSASQVRFQPHDLLLDVEPLGEEGNLRLEPGEGAARLFAGDITGKGLLSGAVNSAN